MSRYDSITRRRFCRNREKAMLGGVCAGFADYFGFNLRVTRILVFIAFLMAMPMTLLIYFGTVLLVPTGPDESSRPEYDPEFRKAVRSAPSQTLGDVRRRFQSLDSRLARLERYVTSSRFKLDQEFRNL
ncbi:MAG: PspC domain-containing protein [Proteobacteria bacterium]|nr:PspC domain-containing protein [Pseudomonadota bacterium]